MEKIKIKEIIINEKLYPREKVNQEKVKEYEQYIGVLPPVTLNQDNVLVDGFHRYYAYLNKEQEEIEYTTIETKNDDDLFLKAIELNSTHGLSLSQKEKKSHVVNLYKRILENTDCGFDVKRLKKVFSVPDSTFGLWTKDLNDELEAQRLEKILNFYLQCKTQQEIADEIGLARNTITDKIKEIERNFKEMSEKPELEIPTKYNFLYEKTQKMSEFNPFLYNIWNTSRLDNEQKEHFGNFPVEFMDNLLYYYTKPFDVVYDPFAGGGVTIDSCKNWLRKYYVSDAFPREECKRDIKQWNILNGLPDDLPTYDFVFLDPPYWKQAEKKYSKDKDDLANISLEEFYNHLETFIRCIKKKLKKGGYAAFVISPTQYPNDDHHFEDHIIRIIEIFKSVKFTEVMRYILPYSTQQYNGTQVNVAKEEKFCLSINRDLVIFRMEKND